MCLDHFSINEGVWLNFGTHRQSRAPSWTETVWACCFYSCRWVAAIKSRGRALLSQSPCLLAQALVPIHTHTHHHHPTSPPHASLDTENTHSPNSVDKITHIATAALCSVLLGHRGWVTFFLFWIFIHILILIFKVCPHRSSHRGAWGSDIYNQSAQSVPSRTHTNTFHLISLLWWTENQVKVTEFDLGQRHVYIIKKILLKASSCTRYKNCIEFQSLIITDEP